MIKRYSDHAANERTFLAWVRTAIAMMGFGFVIERFDLFLRYAAPLAAQQKIAPHGGAFAKIAFCARPQNVGTDVMQECSHSTLPFVFGRHGRQVSNRISKGVMGSGLMSRAARFTAV
jgi:hypothetical protein